MESVDAALAAQGYSLEQLEYEYPLEYQPPPAKQQRADGAGGVAYPDTDLQFDSTMVGVAVASATAAAAAYSRRPPGANLQ